MQVAVPQENGCVKAEAEEAAAAEAGKGKGLDLEAGAGVAVVTANGVKGNGEANTRVGATHIAMRET